MAGRRAPTALDLELPEIVALTGRVGPPVQVRGFLPEFDEAGDRWYCDLRINAGQAYLPFVRLAVARLQEHSITVPPVGLADSPDVYSISPVIRLDAVQLLPDRRLRVTRTGRTVEITLTGPTYTGVLDRDGVLNTGPEAWPGSRPWCRSGGRVPTDCWLGTTSGRPGASTGATTAGGPGARSRIRTCPRSGW